jgi:serine/threonine protein kinase
MANLSEQRLGNYHLICLLGQGGFADVYQGEQIHIGTQAAIKVLHTRLASEPHAEIRPEGQGSSVVDRLMVISRKGERL